MSTIDTEKRFKRLERLGLVSFGPVDDPDVDLDNLFGDTFNPACHPEIPREQIERERQEEINRAERMGVVGIVGSYSLTAEAPYMQADSVWGFIGDDYKGSGYDADVRSATIEALRSAIRSRCRCCKGKGKV